MNKTHGELCEEVLLLRQGIRALAANLGNGEWADLLTADQDLGELEDAVHSLAERHNAQTEQIGELENQAAELSARIVEGDVERDKLSRQAAASMRGAE